ncbi:hypothetical protein [Hafnia paralvei]|uniref:hypothetical protein n=1 Tax=Hafnia paralvei TaxID=546367 RepID=UPI001419A8E7|nr:hypothetical protein [Hafnia paralvei]NIH31751.1 hypothetical protein [Hafnia paralvei]
MNPTIMQCAPAPVIVYAHSWPESCALEAYIEEAYGTARAVRVCERISTLMRVLSLTPQSPLILALNPHEHVNLLYALWPWLGQRPILFVSRTFYYTDRQIPGFFVSKQVAFHCWQRTSERSVKAQPGLLHFLRSAQEPDVLPASTNSAALPTYACEADLLVAINRYLLNQMFTLGVSAKEYEVISLLLLSQQSGASLQGMMRARNMTSKLLSAHKMSVLNKLGMNAHAVSLWRGLEVKMTLQQGIFTLPAWCEKGQSIGTELSMDEPAKGMTTV